VSGLKAESRGKAEKAAAKEVRTVRTSFNVLVYAFRAMPARPGRDGDLISRLSRRFDPRMTSYGPTTSVATLYKRKDKKVHLQNTARLEDARPGGEVFWKDQYLIRERELLEGRKPKKWDKWFIPRFTEKSVGTRLTPI
jgi:hypothetical protein